MGKNRAEKRLQKFGPPTTPVPPKENQEKNSNDNQEIGLNAQNEPKLIETSDNCVNNLQDDELPSPSTVAISRNLESPNEFLYINSMAALLGMKTEDSFLDKPSYRIQQINQHKMAQMMLKPSDYEEFFIAAKANPYSVYAPSYEATVSKKNKSKKLKGNVPLKVKEIIANAKNSPIQADFSQVKYVGHKFTGTTVVDPMTSFKLETIIEDDEENIIHLNVQVPKIAIDKEGFEKNFAIGKKITILDPKLEILFDGRVSLKVEFEDEIVFEN